MPLLLRFDNEAQRTDLVRARLNFVEDPGLESAVVISLFSDAQADPETLAELLASGGSRRGWWADVFLSSPIGSRLWQVMMAGSTTTAPADAESAATDALQWMIDDGVASAVTATASAVGNRLRLSVQIDKPTGQQWAQEWMVPFAL